MRYMYIHFYIYIYIYIYIYLFIYTLVQYYNTPLCAFSVQPSLHISPLCLEFLSTPWGVFSLCSGCVDVRAEAESSLEICMHMAITISDMSCLRHQRVLQGDADEDGDNRISEQEFVNVLQKPQAQSTA